MNNQRVLELRSVDLSKSDQEARDASYTIQLCFSGHLKHGGIALADTDDANTLNVFALTRGNELYTFAIRKDFFCLVAASEEDTFRWCKIARPATFSISAPHCLVAASAVQLVVSLSDGRLLRLTRGKADDGSRWNEAVYGDGQWGSSLRGLVRWQGSNIVRFDGTTLEQSTPIAMAASPDERHIFVVCMNHTLRIWNPKKSSSVFSMDLLWQQREQHEMPKFMLDPGSPNVLQLLKTPGAIEGDLYYAVTFSPHDFGQFKFWAIRDPDHGEDGVRDLFPDDSLKAPDPDPSPESKAIWKVVDFVIKNGPNNQELDIWILMRSSRQYQVYNLKSSLRDLPSRWQDQWMGTVMQVNNELDVPQPSHTDPEDMAEKWLKYILMPGRYPEMIVENALSIYCVGRPIPSERINLKLPLSERMCVAIVSRVNLRITNVDRENYKKAIYLEWTTLWQDIRDLDKSRLDVLSLALDGQIDLPWVIFADECSVLRSCARLETMAHNSPDILAISQEHLEMPSFETETGSDPKLPDELAAVIEAAANLRNSFEEQVQRNYRLALTDELWLEPQSEIPLRIVQLYNQCGIADDVAQTLFDDLDMRLDPIGGLAGLDSDAFFAIIEAFSHVLPDVSSGLSYTKFGVKTLISGGREMVNLRESMLLDLVALAVFVEREWDPEETLMGKFDGPAIYAALVHLLRQYEVMQWLVRNTRLGPTSVRDPRTAKDIKASRDHSLEEKPTILESVFAVDLKPQSNDDQALSTTLTYNIQDLLQWVIGGNNRVSWDEIPVHIQCNLLANKDIELATDFLRFQPSTAWATYIKGRLCLLRGESTEAALYFRKAAFKLCES